MSASVHEFKPYVPNYMMKQSLWNMEQQVSALQGMITPQTSLMAWQPHLVSQAQRDIQNVYNSMAYNKHVHSGEGYGHLRHRPGVSHCTNYYSYLHKSSAAMSRANRYGRMGDRKRMVVWQRKARHFQSLAQAVHAKCHSASYGAYGAYGGCGHCGEPPAYGAGCGTFLRIAVKDPDKKMCILEKKIKRFSKCCEQGKCFLKNKGNQCRKMRKANAELQTLLAAEGGPETLATATDIAYQNVRTGIDAGQQTLGVQQARTQRNILIGVVGSLGLLTAVALLR